MDLGANSGIRGLSESAVLALTVECVPAGSYGVEELTLDSGMREAGPVQTPNIVTSS